LAELKRRGCPQYIFNSKSCCTFLLTFFTFLFVCETVLCSMVQLCFAFISCRLFFWQRLFLYVISALWTGDCLLDKPISPGQFPLFNQLVNQATVLHGSWNLSVSYCRILQNLTLTGDYFLFSNSDQSLQSFLKELLVFLN